MRIAKMGKRCMFVEIFIDDEKSDGIYFGREPLWCSSCTLGQDPHSENPKETENSIPPFALPPLPNPAGEIWHFSLSQSAAKIQFLKSIKKFRINISQFPIYCYNRHMGSSAQDGENVQYLSYFCPLQSKNTSVLVLAIFLDFWKFYVYGWKSNF